MPLPISAQTYIPNPLIGIKAEEAGKSVGSPFSNFTEGLFSGVKSGIEIQQGLQQLEMAPREQARKERQTTLDEQRFGLEERKEERLINAEEFEQDYKTQELDIKRDELQIKRDDTDNKIRIAQAKASLAAQNQAQTNIMDGVMNDVIINGSVDSFDAFWANPKNARSKGKFIDKLATDKTGRAQGFIEKIEDAIAEGQVGPETAISLDSFLRTVEYAKNMNPARERVAANQDLIGGILGALPEKDSRLKIERKGEDYKVFEIPRHGKQIELATVPIGSDPKEIAAVYKFEAAFNKKQRIDAKIADSVKQLAKAKAANRATEDQPTAPVKIAREANVTAARRTGLSNPAAASVTRTQTTTNTSGNTSTATSTIVPTSEQKRREAEERARRRTGGSQTPTLTTTTISP
jgi:hypothetical protein